jgi:endonuclease/exonuclease/phosphatase (EEP) superfamily protein YafD
MFSRILAALTGLAATAVLTVALWPQLVGYERVWPFAVAVGMRGMASMAAIILIFVLLVVGRVGRWLRRTTVTLSVLLLLFVSANVWIMTTRGFDNAELVPEVNGDITVMTWNTMGGSPAPLAIADLAISSDADIISLPETSQQMVTSVVAILSASGKDVTVFTNAFDDVYVARSTALLISTELGEYTLAKDMGDTLTAPTLVAIPMDPTNPTVVAAHVTAPSPGSMASWRTDIAWLADLCSTRNVILTGDLNGSIDNFAETGPAALGGCADAAQVMNAASLGTWPAWVPTFVGAPIDHVMYNGPYLATGFHVYQNPAGSSGDHRPVVARLTPAK